MSDPGPAAAPSAVPSGAPPSDPAAGDVPPAVLAPLALAMLCAVLISATSLPVQSSLLLLPLIALSGLAWRDHLIWAACECTYFVGVWLFIAADSNPGKGLSATIYLCLLLARSGAIGWIGVQAVRRYRCDLRAAGLGPAPLNLGPLRDWFSPDPAGPPPTPASPAQPPARHGRHTPVPDVIMRPSLGSLVPARRPATRPLWIPIR